METSEKKKSGARVESPADESKRTLWAIKKRVWLEKSFGLDGIFRKRVTTSVNNDVSARTGDDKASRQSLLDEIAGEVSQCHRCSLYEQATNPVPGIGNPCAELMFIGEGPGADEDLQGEPFVGRAGQLLTKIIQAMGMQRSEVYITNVVKHRPPGNRTPTIYEMGQCRIFMLRQVEIIKPKIICSLGLPATQTLLRSEKNMGALRGRFYPYPDDPEIKVLPTYHPAYLLRNPVDKRKVWDDMKKILAELGRPIPQKAT